MQSSLFSSRLTGVGSIAAALLVLACGVGQATRQASSSSTCRQNSIDREERVVSDDASLYLLVRGARCDAPLVLWLHGGPGGAETPLFRLYDGALEDSFLVAYWDQRGAGRSYDAGADTAKLTVERHLSDMKNVVDQLRARYAKRKVALIGHSWGSALGLLYAQKNPGDVSVFVGLNQFVSGSGAQQGQYQFVRASAEAARDDKTRQRLKEIGPPPLSTANELRLQALVDRYGGLFHQRPSFAWAMIAAALRGYAAPWRIPAYIRANEISLAAMEKEIHVLDLGKTVQSVKVPVVMMLGRYDRQLDARQAANYFETLSAPAKRLIWFEKSAHNIPFEEPENFTAAITAIAEELIR